MHIQLSDKDIQKMPYSLKSELLVWLGRSSLQSARSLIDIPADKGKPKQLALAIKDSDFRQISSSAVGSSESNNEKFTHVRLRQLFDAGITAPRMPVRVRLLKTKEKQLGYRYATASLEVSPTGTIFYQDEEFHKPSPLAKKVNGRGVNGWEYIEVYKNGNWISLDELRKIWRKHHE